MVDLAAIIAEGEALVAKGHASFFSHDAGAARALDLLPHLLAVAKAELAAHKVFSRRLLEQALRRAARELQYIADDGPCHRLHQTGEGLACIALAEGLLGPMREWPDEPNATAGIARRYFAPHEEKGENRG